MKHLFFGVVDLIYYLFMNIVEKYINRKIYKEGEEGSINMQVCRWLKDEDDEGGKRDRTDILRVRRTIINRYSLVAYEGRKLSLRGEEVSLRIS